MRFVIDQDGYAAAKGRISQFFYALIIVTDA